MMKMTQIAQLDLREYRPVPLWSWNDTLKEPELRRQIDEMHTAGFGGFFMHARAGLGTPYLSEEWMQDVEACIDQAQKQGLRPWIYDENGWPSGFAGMTLLKDPANLAHFLTVTQTETAQEDALASYTVQNGVLKRLAPGQAVQGQTVYNVFDNATPSFADVMNPEVVQKFLHATHEKYAARLGEKLGTVMPGFFTDEPQYYRYATPYSTVVPQAYRDQYGEELLDGLGALFVECDDAYRFRYRYWKLLNRLYTESYAKQVYEWCEAHHCKLTGHTVEETRLHMQMWCTGGVMPFYEYEQIPGIDWLGRNIKEEISPKQVGSVAQQLGKKQVLSEMFACSGWDVTPKELKHIAEFQFVNGVNLMCHHLYPYSIRGQRKRDYPAFYSTHNPWQSEMPRFNHYFTVLGWLLANSRELAPVGVIAPIRSAYLTYDRRTDAESIQTLEADFAALAEKLGSANIGHHYLDETLLERHGRVENGKLILGNCAYSCVVLPAMQGLAANTVELLRQFLNQGGRLWLQGETPCYCDGEKADLSFLKANIRFEELDCDTIRFDRKETMVRSTHRVGEAGEFVYAVNLSMEESCDLTLTAAAHSACRFDIEKNAELPLQGTLTPEGLVLPLHFEPGESKIIRLCAEREELPQNSACSAQKEAEPKAKNQGEAARNQETKYLETVLEPVAQLLKPLENALTLDTVCLSLDGEHFEAPKPVMAVSDALLRRGENRRIWLKYTFEVAKLPAQVRLEAEHTGTPWLVNGQPVLQQGGARLDASFETAEITSLLHIGTNEVVLTVDYTQSEAVFHAMSLNSEENESIINCLAYNTDIEAVYLFGDFAVQGSFAETQPGILRSPGDFALIPAAARADVSCLTGDGYPFFTGAVTFTQTVEVQNPACRLRLDGRFATAKITVNGSDAAHLLFENECDLSPWLHPGVNTLQITLVASHRNLFGPHHFSREAEPKGVSPDTFHLYGSWKDGQSPLYAPDYAFVRFGAKVTLLQPETM